MKRLRGLRLYPWLHCRYLTIVDKSFIHKDLLEGPVLRSHYRFPRLMKPRRCLQPEEIDL